MKPRSVPIVGVAVALAVPLLVTATDARAAMTRALALLLAATALNLAMGLAGQPSLSHGAFMGLGAYSYVLLRERADLGPVLALLIAVVVVTVSGWVVARGVAPLRAPFAALSTWVVAWAFWLALGSFPTLTGGTAGVVVPDARVHIGILGISFRAGPFFLYEFALVAVVAVTLLLVATVRRYGPALSAQRHDPEAAVASGIDVVRVRTVAFVASSVAAALAGILLAQTAGVADPTTFRPLLSIELFLVVVVGGAGELAGPAVGLASLLVVSGAARALGHLVGVSGQRVEPLAAAALLALVVTVGRRGIVPLIRERLPRREIAERPGNASSIASSLHGATIEARDVTVSFGGLRALSRVTFSADAGRCHALIGPNGSGKTTLLRVLAGALAPDEGDVFLDGQRLHQGAPEERAHAGVVRTLQRLALVPGMSATDSVISGMEPARLNGLVRSLARTPNARQDECDARATAHEILQSLGVSTTTEAQGLDFGAGRLLQFARALAAGPRVLLLDEPSAGLDSTGTQRLLATLARARDTGITVVLVAHDLVLVRSIADRVTVLDAGSVIAEGTPVEISADPNVRAAYLGD